MADEIEPEIDLETDEEKVAMTPEIAFLGWDKPLLTQLVDHLLEKSGAAKELTDQLVVVPTVQSGRQLRRALAEAGVALAPRVVTPNFFLAKHDSGAAVADLYAWMEVLLDLDLEDARGLFPKDPPEGVMKSFSWALNVAKQLSQLQKTLEESGKSFAEVSRRNVEQERWTNLAMLHKRVEKMLWKWKIARQSEHETIPSDCKITLAGISDVSSVVESRLVALLEGDYAVEVLVHAPADMGYSFDVWGRPLAEMWESMEIALPQWQERVVLSENPALAAKVVVEEIATLGLSPQEITLAVCDRTMVMSVEREFKGHGWPLYDPDGSSIKASSLVQFLTAMRNWLRDDRPVSALLEMLRLPESDAFLPDDVSRFSVLIDLENLYAERLEQSALDLQGYLTAVVENDLKPRSVRNPADLKTTVDSFLTQTDELHVGSKLRGLRGWVAKMMNRTSKDVAAALVDDLAAIFDTLVQVEKSGGGLKLSECIKLIIEALDQKKSFGNVEGTVLDIRGWMELPYEDAPQVMLMGMHEGVVPERSGDDPFLPDNFKQMLGMESGQQRYARDSFLLRSLLESREKVMIYLTKMNDANEPNSASRLLLRTSGKDLSMRVQTFFGEAQNKPSNPTAWQRDWQLSVAEKDNPFNPESEQMKRLSPSALRDYLTCPFRFYLKRVVKMERYEAHKTEMDARDFGNIVHAVVEDFGLDEEMRESIKGNEIAKFFESLLEKEAFRRFGAHPNLAVQMQLQIAQDRLNALAHHQADQRAQGWQIRDVELSIGADIEWSIGDHPIGMMLDRVDIHETTGAVRVMDYKTSSKAKKPNDAHIANFKAEENRPILGDLLPKAPRGRSERRWSNLQLPMYAWFAQQHYSCDEIPEVGYIQLPNAVTDTKFEIWDTFDETLLESAQQWTLEAISRIEKGEFFSPSELNTAEKGWDEFSKLAQGNIAEAFGLV